MNGLPSIRAILEAIAALPEPARQRLVTEMRQRGYLDTPGSRLPSPPSSLASPAIAARESAAPPYQVQLGDGPDGLLCATVVGWEDCKSFGRDRLEAIQNLIRLLGAQAANGDLIALQPASTMPEEDYSEAERKLRNYQQVLLYLEDYQRQLTATSEE